MIHQNNPLTHFFNLHTVSSGGETYRSDATDDEEIDVDDSVNNKGEGDEQTDPDLDMVSGSVGKSFTIAAILGLKGLKAAAAAGAGAFNKPTNFGGPFNHSHLSAAAGQRPFNDMMGLSSMKPQQPQHHQAYDNLAMSRLQNNPNFLANSFQHHGGGPTNGGGGSALQSLQKLHQQHVAANSMGHGNGFRLMNRTSELSKSKSQSSLKSKRVRTIFTPEQLERLEAEFERQQYMVGPERLYLAHTLQLTEAQVKVWFQNRRIKWRKHHLEMTQQRLAILRNQRQIPNTGGGNGAGVGGGSNTIPLASSPVSNSEEVTALSTDSRDSNGDV